MSAKRVLNVGQCSMDHGNISIMLTHLGADTVAAASLEEAMQRAKSQAFDLVLINRLLDADGSPGLDILRAFKSDDTLKHLPVMLVSNYPDAQREAVALGALPGFGKNALSQSETQSRLREVLKGA